MKKTYVLFLLLIGLSPLMLAQDNDPVLLTLDNQPVHASEFRHVYAKNLELVKDEEQKSVEGYLDLFVDFKRKVREAYAQGLDEADVYKREFKHYKDQLARSFLYEEKITEELILEGYERGKEEVRVSHLLIACTPDAVPQDTLVAYNKAAAARERAIKGEDFTGLIMELSDEPGIERNQGDLGYFTVFKMVYDFENVAYATPKGEISEVFRTQYGYHILKVLDRRDRVGKIAVSHIMLSTRMDSTDAPKKRIYELYQLLQQGESFDDLAEQYSDDRRTGKEGGRMRPFTRGDLKVPAFEDRAYALENPGDISEPIQSPFGWHIIRLDQKFDLPTLEEERANITSRVKDGERATIVNKAINEQIKDRVGFEAGPDYKAFFNELVGEEVLQRKWVLDSTAKGLDQTLFVAGTLRSTYGDLAQYLYKQQGKIRPHQQKQSLIDFAYQEYLGLELRKAFKIYLEKNEPKYSPVVREYREGLLIYEVMDKNVWEKASLDTLGQEQFYKAHLDRYQWKKRAVADVYTAFDEATINTIQQYLGEGRDAEAIQEALNTKDEVKVVISSSTFEKGAKELPVDYDFKAGLSKVHQMGSSFVLVNASEILPAGPKEFDEVQGRVLSDYQAQLEVEWMESLREKYPVEVNKKTLKSLQKEFGQ